MADNENKKKGFFSGVFDKIASKFKKAPQAETKEPEPVEETLPVVEETPVPVVEEKFIPEPVAEVKPEPVVIEKPTPAPVAAVKPVIEEKPPAVVIAEPPAAPKIKEKPAFIPAPYKEERKAEIPVMKEVPKTPEKFSFPAPPPPPKKDKPAFIPLVKAKVSPDMPEKQEKPEVKPVEKSEPIQELKPKVAPAVEVKPVPVPVAAEKPAPAPVAQTKAVEPPAVKPEVESKPVVEQTPVIPVAKEEAPAPKPKNSFLPFFKEKPAPAPVVKEESAPVLREKSIPEAEPVEEEKPKAGFFDKIKPANWFSRLKEGLDKTRKNLVFKMKGLFRLRERIDDDFWDELEEILLTADVGIDTTEYVIEQMKKAVEEHYIEKPDQLYEVMKDKLSVILDKGDSEIKLSSKGLTVILVIGVNGVGKTTSIAKIANKYMQEGKQVLVAAADTFRAAAIEQLEVWGKKLDLEIIKHKEGADPSAVVFDAVSAAVARKADLLIIDTAGRLHSKVNLMKELEKIKKVIQKSVPDGPHETLLVLDSTNGQNAQVQARTFKESMKISGIVLTKLDGTAKGGIIISIVHELGIPIKYIGVGEGVYDLRPFEPRSFLDALFEDDSDKVPAAGS